MRAKEALGTYEIAKLCGVAPSTVGRWIESGRVASFRTLGGQRRVLRKDIMELMVQMGIPLPEGWVMRPGPVLIVEDEPSVRRFLVGAIRDWRPDAEVHEASNGFEAGRKAAELRPALLVLDLNIPGANGVDVCRALRSDPSYNSTRILAVSGGGAAVRDEVLAAGADDFLAKPVELEPLVAVLGRIAGRT